MASIELPILHFNDVYRVQPQKLPSSTRTVSASQFTHNLDAIRSKWENSTDSPGLKDGLVLFSGDLFSPSIESGVTRGSHMVPVINMIGPDVALTGNHDFDFGYPHLTKLVGDCKFPWLLSNIIDRKTGKVPASLHEFYVTKRCGVTVGVIGLVEEDWLQTVSSWPPDFVYQPMDKVGLDLSARLRASPYNCEFIIALTHSRLPNDITLANQLGARRKTDPKLHGVDIIFGGHDHMYFIGRGVDEWDNWDFSRVILGAVGDKDTLVVKSGTDFRDLTELTLVLEDSPAGCVRRKTITHVRGRHHVTVPEWPSCPEFDAMLKSIVGEVQQSLSKPICVTLTEWDVRSEHVRSEESAIGDWLADILRHAYDEAICIADHPNGAADGVIICGGTLRGDSKYGPGQITLGDILEILPFDDATVMLELTGEDIWNTLENGLSTWPALEGRFPIVAGIRVEWDSRLPPKQRVVSVRLVDDSGKIANDAVPRTRDKKYAIVTREYMAEGFDGFEALKGRPYLIDPETGVLMSTLIRKSLLGSHYIRAYENSPDAVHLSAKTEKILEASMRARQEAPSAPELSCKEDIQNAFHVGGYEHLSTVDCHESTGMRGETGEPPFGLRADLPAVAPKVDGRFRDLARS